jgi:Uma2 family endonuclease
MNVASPSHTSFEDYLVGEASGDVKHEWCDGVVYAMSRGTPEHARLTMRIARAIGAAIEKECEVYSSDLMLYVEAAKLSTYADASVVCGSVETKTVRKNGKSLGEAVTNPTIIVEVLRRLRSATIAMGNSRHTSDFLRSKSTSSSHKTSHASKFTVARVARGTAKPVARDRA